MAGSYKHVVTEDGTLGTPEFVNEMLENGGDVYEAVEELYGMIWFLAGFDRSSFVARSMVETARQSYKRGLQIAREAHS